MSEVNEMKSLTLNGTKYDSFPDQTARATAASKLPGPASAVVGQYLVVEEVDAEGKITKVKTVEAPGGSSDSGQNGLTTAQIDALHGMFKVCAYDDSKDVSGAYAAFKTAFGITDTEGDSGEDSGGSGEDSGGDSGETEVTLTSISAVYSGGDVAVGTAVTALTGIVVTAHYSDGTSAPVTGYTLSGTIAEGSNTVTVSYGGKTATFTVTGVAESGGGDAGETKTLTMTMHTSSLASSTFYEGDADSTVLEMGNGYWYKSDVIADEDTVVSIAFTAGSKNETLFYYAAQIKQEDHLKLYYVEKLGSAATTETVKNYTVRAGYELVLCVANCSQFASLNVTYSDGSFTDVTEFYTNLVDGYTLNAYLKSSDGSVTNPWSQQDTSDLIDVSSVASVHIWHISRNVMQQCEMTYAFYDSSETFISGGGSPANTDPVTAVAIPEGAKYMRVGSAHVDTLNGVYVGTNPEPYRGEFVAFV